MRTRLSDDDADNFYFFFTLSHFCYKMFLKIPPLHSIARVNLSYRLFVIPINELPLSDEAIWVEVGVRLQGTTCQPHPVDDRCLHGLSFNRSGPRQLRHAHMSDTKWIAVKKAQYPTWRYYWTVKNRLQETSWSTFIPLTSGQKLAWDVTI